MGRIFGFLASILKLVILLVILLGSLLVARAIIQGGIGGLAEIVGPKASQGPTNPQPDAQSKNGGKTPTDKSVIAKCDSPSTIPESDSPTHPFAGETLIVGLELKEEPWFDIKKKTRRALLYWERNSEEYAGFSIEYKFRPEADDPDILIRYRNQSADINAYGSALELEPDHVKPDTTVVCINVQNERAPVGETIKHEIGHTLGLSHDDEPQSIMRDPTDEPDD